MLNDNVQYPIKTLDRNDPRFTFGLLTDVAAVLQEHGYPRIRTGADLIRLRQALWSFLYSTTSV
ncbi:hypothetical protein [Amycolatopsis sp.]|uniref:hypothetical protein n=1 Tax=Amycolatopsis sp. TaxID=37632 RepID=UPI002C02DBA7|nr:hypothetical protein [Amycolatopsis sp.]HVV09025.1 hypothetical protein [Amycolatopsis sp.]